MLKNNTVVIRKSTKNDAKEFSDLILISSPYFPELFGDKIKSALNNLFQHSSNLFSFENVYFIQVNNNKAGMILSWEEKLRKTKDLYTGFLLFSYLKWNMVKKIFTLFEFNKKIGNIPEESQYISNIAIYPEYRGMGLSKKLMELAEEQAVSKRLKFLVLDVEQQNNIAINLYTKIGYKIVEDITIRLSKNNKLNFFRMIKKII